VDCEGAQGFDHPRLDGKWIVKARKDSTIRAGIVTVTVE